MQQLLIASEESFQNGRALFVKCFRPVPCSIFHVFDDIADFTPEDTMIIITVIYNRIMLIIISNTIDKRTDLWHYDYGYQKGGF